MHAINNTGSLSKSVKKMSETSPDNYMSSKMDKLDELSSPTIILSSIILFHQEKFKCCAK